MKPLSLIVIFILCILPLPQSLARNKAPTQLPEVTKDTSRSQLIVWDVGQGQWVTWFHEGICEHFDIGGEFAPWQQIRKLCADRPNRAHFSHWDWDHIGLATRAARELKKFCVDDFPAGIAPNHGKEKLLNLPRCEQPEDDSPMNTEPESKSAKETRTRTSRIHRRSLKKPEARLRSRQLLWRHHRGKLSSNDLSRVFDLGDWAVVPGDSTTPEERIWTPLEVEHHPKILVLGHHGSRTSTSEFLVSHLKQIQTAISSARIIRYGHPHREVVDRLKRNGIALLRTEEWGSIKLIGPILKSE